MITYGTKYDPRYHSSITSNYRRAYKETYSNGPDIVNIDEEIFELWKDFRGGMILITEDDVVLEDDAAVLYQLHHNAIAA